MVVQYHSITYIQIRVPFQAIFKDSSQNPHPPYIEIADISNIKQDNPYNKQASFLYMYQIYVSLLSSPYIEIMFTLKGYGLLFLPNKHSFVPGQI